MNKKNEKYDLICSLGGNCMATSQIRQRGLRVASLPFDWTFIVNDKPLYKLAEGFKNKFKDFFLKENLQEMTDEEKAKTAHEDMAKYVDTFSNYYYINHFQKNIEIDNEYEKVKEKYDRRIERFIAFVEKADSILFVLSTFMKIDEKPIINLYKTLLEIYPNKIFKIISIQFNPYEDVYSPLIDDDEHIVLENGHIEFFRYKRRENFYDYGRTNIEWDFLDNIELSDKLKIPHKKEYKLIEIHKIKRGLAVSILPFLFSVISIKLYILGLGFNFSIGRLRKDK